LDSSSFCSSDIYYSQLFKTALFGGIIKQILLIAK
jgi:hypothetical protein